MVIKTLPGAAASRSFHPVYFLSVHPLNAAAWLATDGGARQRHLLVSAGDLCFGWGLIAGTRAIYWTACPWEQGGVFYQQLLLLLVVKQCQELAKALVAMHKTVWSAYACGRWLCVPCVSMASRVGPTSVLLPHRASYVSCWTAPLISHCCAYHDGTRGGTASSALPTFMPSWCQISCRSHAMFAHTRKHWIS